jgi:shikimate kinase
VSDDTARRHLVLVGLMGAGKTTVGERCAARLGRPFVDTDDLVETRTGRTVAALFAEGEPTFRAAERDAVADACASPAPLVIACGGGAVLDPDSRRRLRTSGFVVWLRAAPQVLAERVQDDPVERPLLAREGRLATLNRLAETRAPAYEAAADVSVTTEGHSPDQVAATVLEELDRCAA